MASTIVNPTGETNIFGTNGAALSAQPTNGTIRTTGPGTVSVTDATVYVDAPQGENIEKWSVSPNLFGYVDATPVAGVSVLGVADASDKLRITYDGAISNDLEAGDYIVTNLGYLFSIHAIDSAKEVVTFNISYDNRTTYINTGSNPTFYTLPKSAMKQARDGQYIIFGNSGSIAGSANTAIKSGSTEPNRDGNFTTKVRTTRTALAIQAGYWNEYTGSWSTAPTTADDTSALSITSDNAYTQSGKITYMATGKTPTRVAYNA